MKNKIVPYELTGQCNPKVSDRPTLQNLQNNVNRLITTNINNRSVSYILRTLQDISKVI